MKPSERREYCKVCAHSFKVQSVSVPDLSLTSCVLGGDSIAALCRPKALPLSALVARLTNSTEIS